MTRLALLTVAVCAAVARAAPPVPQFYQQQQIQQINPLDYYLENQEVANFYNQGQQKQAGNTNGASNSAPAHLETLEPDSEVELIPGAQQPQPPQQTPVSPNLPGLLPGQRVYIVHMPVPGIRPGTIGGYQPVYIVAAAPQGNSYAANVPGFQNTLLVDPSGQVVPAGGFRGPLLFGAPLAYRPLYQDPRAYQGQAGVVQGRVSPITSSVSDSKSNIDADKERESLQTKQNLEEPRRNKDQHLEIQRS